MADFDVSREWVILAPASVAEKNAAEELSRYIDLLRGRCGLSLKPPVIKDAAGPAPDDTVPVILLNSMNRSRDHGGYSWRLGKDRVEIYGDSDRGLCGGVFDFLAALGIRWPEPGREELPAAENGKWVYPLSREKAYFASDTAPENRRRLVLNPREKVKTLNGIIRWAARNQYGALVVSLRDAWDKYPWDERGAENRPGSPADTAARYAMIVERGGWDLSLLVPRRLFFFHRDMFRMAEGKRTGQYNFCPTNPDTIAVLQNQARSAFRQADAANGRTADRPADKADRTADKAPRVFHLWPDRGHEKTWCSCPACRAFSPEEQNRIAVNSAADILLELDPSARLSFFEGENLQEGNGLPMRKNVFMLKKFPENR